MIPIAFSALLSGYLFYAHEYEKPSYWIALYSAFGKNVWGLFGATIITGIAVNTGCECELWFLTWVSNNKMCAYFNRGIERDSTAAHIPNIGPSHIWSLSYSSGCDTHIIWKYTSARLWIGFQNRKLFTHPEQF